MNMLTAEIVTLKTNLYLSMDIGVVLDPSHFFRDGVAVWEKYEGALNIGDEKGSWLFKGSVLPYEGLNLFAFREDKHYWESVALATLYDVPTFFYKSLNCGEEYSGEGVLHRTNESLAWRMSFPCV